MISYCNIFSLKRENEMYMLAIAAKKNLYTFELDPKKSTVVPTFNIIEVNIQFFPVYTYSKRNTYYQILLNQ